MPTFLKNILPIEFSINPKTYSTLTRILDFSLFDEIFELLLEFNPKVSRNAVYRCLVRENLNKVPKEVREKAKKFKEYDPEYLHIDVTY